MKEIYLIRHARQNITAFNLDVPLSEKSIQQAELLEKRLSGLVLDKIYSSTLTRAIETADIINRKRKMEIERRSELNEIDYGELTSLPLSVKNNEYKEFFSKLERREEDIAFPKGENSESVFKRTSRVFREIEKNEYEHILIVTHGGAIRASLCGLLNLPFARRLIFSKHLENTSITKLLFDEQSGLYYLETLNDHQHLISRPELLREF